MPHTIHIEISDDEMLEAADAVQPYRALIRATPELLSLLYDIDLLPEQIRYMPNAMRMIAVCELFKRAAIADAKDAPNVSGGIDGDGSIAP